jgi:citrate synthase
MNNHNENDANMERDQFVARLSEFAADNNKIDPFLFDYFGVKRGLRNNDGTGVLVGLTQIGDVHGYIMDEGHKVPVEGRLRYRGINVEDIINGCRTDGWRMSSSREPGATS